MSAEDGKERTPQKEQTPPTINITVVYSDKAILNQFILRLKDDVYDPAWSSTITLTEKTAFSHTIDNTTVNFSCSYRLGGPNTNATIAGADYSLFLTDMTKGIDLKDISEYTRSTSLYSNDKAKFILVGATLADNKNEKNIFDLRKVLNDYNKDPKNKDKHKFIKAVTTNAKTDAGFSYLTRFLYRDYHYSQQRSATLGVQGVSQTYTLTGLKKIFKPKRWYQPSSGDPEEWTAIVKLLEKTKLTDEDFKDIYKLLCKLEKKNKMPELDNAHKVFLFDKFISFYLQRLNIPAEYSPDHTYAIEALIEDDSAAMLDRFLKDLNGIPNLNIPDIGGLLSHAVDNHSNRSLNTLLTWGLNNQQKNKIINWVKTSAAAVFAKQNPINDRLLETLITFLDMQGYKLNELNTFFSKPAGIKTIWQGVVTRNISKVVEDPSFWIHQFLSQIPTTKTARLGFFDHETSAQVKLIKSVLNVLDNPENMETAITALRKISKNGPHCGLLIKGLIRRQEFLNKGTKAAASASSSVARETAENPDPTATSSVTQGRQSTEGEAKSGQSPSSSPSPRKSH